MKTVKKYLFFALLVMSLFCNALLCFHIVQKKSEPSITRFYYDMHNLIIYCEKTAEINTIKADYGENSFTIGESRLLNTVDSLYLINNKEKIKLSDYEGFGFVINSEGELLYSLNTPVKKQQTVYITPTGKKYHTDPDCAGKTGFEIELETAKLFRQPCSICA